MNKNKLFNLSFQCEDCKRNFPVDMEHAPNSLTHKKEYKVNGQSIFLTYYDCSYCGRRHFVQIDDEKSLKMLEDNKKLFTKLCVAKHNGKKISQKQSTKFKGARQDLSDYRIELMKEYTGKLIYDSETEKEIELRFSV